MKPFLTATIIALGSLLAIGAGLTEDLCGESAQVRRAAIEAVQATYPQARVHGHPRVFAEETTVFVSFGNSPDRERLRVDTKGRIWV